MNNQMPNINPNLNLMNSPNQNFLVITIERINNRISRLEKEFRILENKVNRLSANQTLLNNEYEDNNNMYML